MQSQMDINLHRGAQTDRYTDNADSCRVKQTEVQGKER